VRESALIVIARKDQMDKTRAQNDAVLAAAATSDCRFYPVVSVHPADGDAALAELERTAKRGAKEVKLHPNTQNFDVADPSVGTVVEKCGELGLWTMRKVGIDRILFGSDWPVYTPSEAIRAVRHLGLTETEQRKVFYDNAAQLLGVGDTR
jgi:predicted TIM-barrel fold metal-dependent hydrolase